MKIEKTIAELPSGEKAVTAVISFAEIDRQSQLLGTLKFPNQRIWAKFIGAFQRGSLDVHDMVVEVVAVSKPELAKEAK